jgi:LPXTG-motif cell wall-anchored protein
MAKTGKWHSSCLGKLLPGALLVAATTVGMVGQAAAAVTLNGGGSSFAAPAVTQWVTDVSHSPYSLSLNYSTSNSGQGRYEFTNETADFAVSDTGYVNASVGTTPPSFPFDFIPVTAAGVAFMYNVPGLTHTLQLTSYTACLLLTGQINNWDDPAFHLNGANTGITLPNLQVRPVTESDPAGTNFVLEEYCIDTQPAVWAKYAQNMSGTAPPSGVRISATVPNSNWEAPSNGYDEQSTSAVASNVANTAGAIGPVQENYAVQSQFTGSNPAKAVAAVQNASGDFTLPTPIDVASALAYATQQSNGTHVLNFSGLGPKVYNPSTYSYLLTPTKGWPATKGAVMSPFVNYVLTLGQQEAPKIGFASLGLSLERYGIDKVTSDVPGAVAPTAAESNGYSCGDLTPVEVQAGASAPTCGVTNGAPPPPPPGAPNTPTVSGSGSTTPSTALGTSSTTKSSTVTSATTKSAAGPAPTTKTVGSASSTSKTVEGVSSTSNTGGGSSSSSPAVGSGVDPSVALTGAPAALPSTGVDSVPLALAGAILMLVGWLVRRRLIVRPLGQRKR